MSGQDGSVAKTDDRVDRQSVAEVSYSDAVIVEKLLSGDDIVVERIPSVIIRVSEIPQLNLHDVELGYVKAQTMLCQMTLLMEDASENGFLKSRSGRVGVFPLQHMLLTVYR